jgi:HlyD family secretion protein
MMKRIALLAISLAGMAVALAGYWPGAAKRDEMRLPGTVEIQEVRLGSRTGGRVVEVLVDDGDTVEAGQKLVRFDAEEAMARREQARQRLAVAQAAWKKADRGPLHEEIMEAKAAAAAAKARFARVTTGFREERKQQLQSELSVELANFRRAEDEFARVKNTSAVSVLDRENARAARDQAKGKVAAAQASLELVNRGNTQDEIDEAKAEWDRFEARHALMRRGTREEDKSAAYAAVAEAEARLAEAETAVSEATVVAPEKCLIEIVSVRTGDLVPAGQSVIRALRADDLWVKVFVPSTELGKIRLGRAVEVSVDSYPGRRFAGKVSHIASVSEFTPRNVQSLDERKHQVFAVKVSVADPDGVFKSGMAAEVFLNLSEGQ